METSQSKKETQEEVYDLGNFSDFDEEGDQDACGGDNNHKSVKDSSKSKTCQTDGNNKVCTTECQAKATPVETISSDKLCKKCKQQKGTLKYRSEPVCKECYLSGLEHRFRSNLRTQVKLSKKDDEVLCCLSGGQSSLALCRLISECLYNPGPRKMFFKAYVIHINEAAVAGISEEEEQDNLAKIRKFSEVHKLSTTIRNIEDIYDVQSGSLKQILYESYGFPAEKEEVAQGEPKLLEKAEKRDKLRKLLASLSDTGSSKEDILMVFKKILIADHASNNNLHKLFFADTAQKVAINSLTLLCKGRGADLFNQVSAEEKTFGDIVIYRPMNDFLTKEVLVYDHFNKLNDYCIIYPKLEDSVPTSRRYPGNGSINTLLENFVDKLQAGFPSTVHTVLNTLTKIKPKYTEKKICPICWGRKDKLGNILEKGSIIQYLKPQGTAEEVLNNKDKGTTFDMDFESKKIKQDYLNSDYFKAKNTFEKVACFSCGRTFENAKDEGAMSDNLPGFIQSSANNIAKQTMPTTINEKAFDYYFYNYDEDY